MKRIFKQLVSLVIAAILLSACSKEVEEQIACPGVEVLQDLGELVRFRPGSGRDATDVLIEAWVDGVGGRCVLDGKELLVDINVRLGMRRGPAADTRKVKIGYLVAITNLNRNVLSRQPFEAMFPFSNRKTILSKDTLDLRIPLQPGQQTNGFLIYVGLELSEQELAYNRRKRR